MDRGVLSCQMIFFSVAVYYGTWAIRLPDVRALVDASYTGMGVVGMAFAAGAVTMMVVSSRLINHLGFGKAISNSAWLLALTFAGVSFVNSLSMLVVLSFACGLAIGLTEVAMNAQASDFETIFGKPMMSRFHGFFSLGILVGSLSSSIMVEFDVSLTANFVGIAGSLWLLTIVFAHNLPSHSRAPNKLNTHPSIFFLWPAAIMFVCVVSISSSLMEGAVDSWGALYMTDLVDVNGLKIGLGVVIFNILMVVGRFAGDRLGEYLGVRKFLLIQLLLVIFACYLLFTYQSFWLSMVSFALAGLGVSNMVPIAFSQAGKNPDVATPVGISIVSVSAYGAFMAAPAIEGLIADYFGLPSIFFAILVVFLLLLCLVSWRGHRWLIASPQSLDY
ncbi:MAG: hypothetical protein CL398_08120 [Acidiferrobacteraceae bacterium]|nr:hypothetical protein [Acidiferrobacteraceae bacterium]|tara:strand:- start:275 stop:1441 length:1167 start_codon:yes stop_codon:yes gene_type:complete